VPDCLRGGSGESLYVNHEAARYTTGAQLDLQARLLADSAETGAPRLDPATAAQLPGATQARLEAQLAQAGDGDPATNAAQGTGPPTGCGLRPDRAAAAFWILTSARSAEVLARPAGSGKTTTVAEMARLWRQAGGGEVIGLTSSQTAANILASAGIIAHNTARFLGHTKTAAKRCSVQTTQAPRCECRGRRSSCPSWIRASGRSGQPQPGGTPARPG